MRRSGEKNMRICLYGASSNDLDARYLDAAHAIGKLLAEHGHSLVYGGGAQGIMGATARGVREGGGEVLGVAPDFLNVDGVLYDGCTQFIYTKTMRERKQIMEEQAEAFILAPGGFGSFEEFFEILTLKQLGRHNKAIAILNTNGYYEPMQQMMRNAVTQGFARAACLEIYRMFDDGAALLDYLEHYDPQALDVKHLKNI